MSEADKNVERVIKVADIDARYRHAIIFQLFEHLRPGSSLQLVMDHDPKPLRFQIEARHGSRCEWSYLEAGPDVWRVRLRWAGAAAASKIGRSSPRPEADRKSGRREGNRQWTRW